MKTIILIAMAMTLCLTVQARSHKSANSAARKAERQDLLIKLATNTLEPSQILNTLESQGAKIEKISDQWFRVQTSKNANLRSLSQDPSIEVIQPNYKIKLLENYQIQDPLRRAALSRMISRNLELRTMVGADNPTIPDAAQPTTGADPLFAKQWGMLDIGVQDAWKVTKGNIDVVVAVIDTGVDYTHEDLLPNLWRNFKEIPNNNIDDDNNGYVDDIIGWDFSSNDNKPYDLAMSPLDILMKGGNPGHGTHCAGNVAARGGNNKGVSGVAPNVKIMSLRFISEKGSGTTADAIKAIEYAVKNGAKVMSNSWGSEGEDPEDSVGNKALRDAVQFAQDNGVLFIAAAGNGHKGVGYDNDTDAAPSFPASYDHDIIISVAAIDKTDKLGSFSNWGAKTVDIAAPGVVVFSTTVDNNYSDIVVDKFGFKATWDGTSMATPHVAGAAALYWSANPQKSWQDVKTAILGSAKPLPILNGKMTSNGKLDVKTLLNP